jgi:hypothetical protein
MSLLGQLRIGSDDDGDSVAKTIGFLYYPFTLRFKKISIKGHDNFYSIMIDDKIYVYEQHRFSLTFIQKYKIYNSTTLIQFYLK